MPVQLHSRHVIHHQLERLGLDRERGQRARAMVTSPRQPEEICQDAPPRLRRFLLEQLLLADLGLPAGSTAHGDYVARFAEAAGIAPEELAAMQIEAAAFHADHEEWFRAFGLPVSPEWSELAEEWNEFGERMVEKVAAVVAENMEAIVTEIRETGELGTLLAKATTGQKLSATERRKVKDQLIDLAKAVPALAIFAAPGGMVLLPLLAKLLPFDLLPSAFQSKKKGPGPRQRLGPARAGSRSPMATRSSLHQGLERLHGPPEARGACRGARACAGSRPPMPRRGGPPARASPPLLSGTSGRSP